MHWLLSQWASVIKADAKFTAQKQFPADLVIFTEEINNGKIHFLCGDYSLLSLFWRSFRDVFRTLSKFKTWRLAKIFAKSRFTIFTKRSVLMFDRVLTITSHLLIVPIHLRILMVLIQFSGFFQMTINTAQKMKFSIKDFSSKCDQIRRKLWKNHFLCSENIYQIPKQTFFREFDFTKIITKKYSWLGLCDVSFA